MQEQLDKHWKMTTENVFHSSKNQKEIWTQNIHILINLLLLNINVIYHINMYDIHSFIHSFTYSFTYSFIHSFIHLLIHLLKCQRESNPMQDSPISDMCLTFICTGRICTGRLDSTIIWNIIQYLIKIFTHSLLRISKKKRQTI